jgi:YhcH/YjgK/YiaL family protein
VIIDKIENYGQYSLIGKKIGSALEYIWNTDFGPLENGRHEIGGDEMYLLLSEYLTKDAAECKIEAHRKYIDVQYMIEGTEQVGYVPLARQVPVTDYDEKNDYILYKGQVSYIDFNEGMFAIFFPGDLHMPGVGKKESQVRKAVVKVNYQPLK